MDQKFYQFLSHPVREIAPMKSVVYIRTYVDDIAQYSTQALHYSCLRTTLDKEKKGSSRCNSESKSSLDSNLGGLRHSIHLCQLMARGTAYSVMGKFAEDCLVCSSQGLTTYLRSTLLTPDIVRQTLNTRTITDMPKLFLPCWTTDNWVWSWWAFTMSQAWGNAQKLLGQILFKLLEHKQLAPRYPSFDSSSKIHCFICTKVSKFVHFLLLSWHSESSVWQSMRQRRT